MFQYDKVNVKLSDSLRENLKSTIKNGNKVSLELSLDIIGTFNNNSNFLRKL